MATRNANGLGHFENLSNGKVRMRKQSGTLPNGKPKILTVTAASKSACIKAMKIKEKEWTDSLDTTESIMRETVSGLCYKHLEYDIMHKSSFKPTAIDRRECTIRNQIDNPKYRISQMQVQSVTGTDVLQHIQSLNTDTDLSTSTIKKAFDVINSAFKWAVKQDFIKKNPCDSIIEDVLSEFKALNDIEDATIKKVNALSRSQIVKLELACRIRNRNNGKLKYSAALYVLFLLYTGIRAGEFCALRYGDIKYLDRKVFITINKTRSTIKNRTDAIEQHYVEHEGNTKNVKARVLQLSDKAIAVLEEIKGETSQHTDQDYIVKNERYKPTTPSKLGKCINTIYRNAGLPEDISGAHVLRKTYATERYREGVDVTRIATYLGDIPSTVWEHYISGQDTIDAGADQGELHYIAAL